MAKLLKKVVGAILHKQEEVCEKIPTSTSSLFWYHASRFHAEFLTNNAYLFHPHIYQRLWEEFMQSWGMFLIFPFHIIILDPSLSFHPSLSDQPIFFSLFQSLRS